MTDLDGGNCATRAQALSNRLNGHAVDWHGTVLPISASVGYVEYAPTDTPAERSEEHTSELQSLMRISYAVFCLKKNNTNQTNIQKRCTALTHTKHTQPSPKP